MRSSSIFVAGEGLLLKTWIISCCGRGDLGALRTQAAQVSVTHGEWVSRCCPKVFTSTRTLGKCCCLMPEILGGGGYQKHRLPDESGDWVPLMWATSLWGLLWQLGDGVTERTNGECVCAHGAGMAKEVLIEWAQGGFPKQWEDCVCMCVFARRKSSREFLCTSCGSMVCITPQHYKCFFYCNSSSAFSLNSYNLIATVLFLQSNVCVCVWQRTSINQCCWWLSR